MDLTEFITARLDEDEAAAKAAALDAYRIAGRAHWSAELGTIVTDAKDLDWAIADLSVLSEDGRLARHIARHDPARVLRDVEAKRAILALDDNPEGYAYGVALERVIVRMAAAWSDHPDYDPAWAV